VPLAAIRHAGEGRHPRLALSNGVDGALVEAISLVNPTAIFQEQATRQVTFHHLELESHDIILAEGSPCESYLDIGTPLQAA
jgi:hypothetical protein